MKKLNNYVLGAALALSIGVTASSGICWYNQSNNKPESKQKISTEEKINYAKRICIAGAIISYVVGGTLYYNCKNPRQ